MSEYQSCMRTKSLHRVQQRYSGPMKTMVGSYGVLLTRSNIWLGVKLLFLCISIEIVSVFIHVHVIECVIVIFSKKLSQSQWPATFRVMSVWCRCCIRWCQSTPGFSMTPPRHNNAATRVFVSVFVHGFVFVSVFVFVLYQLMSINSWFHHHDMITLLQKWHEDDSPFLKSGFVNQIFSGRDNLTLS